MLKCQSKLCSYKLFSNAYQWLCKSRKKQPPSSDIWNFHRDCNGLADTVIDDFLKGLYQFDTQDKITLSEEETIAIWSSQDALVQKVLAQSASGSMS
jgi:RNA-directed DNA polymerase